MKCPTCGLYVEDSPNHPHACAASGSPVEPPVEWIPSPVAVMTRTPDNTPKPKTIATLRPGWRTTKPPVDTKLFTEDQLIEAVMADRRAQRRALDERLQTESFHELLGIFRAADIRNTEDKANDIIEYVLGGSARATSESAGTKQWGTLKAGFMSALRQHDPSVLRGSALRQREPSRGDDPAPLESTGNE